MTSIGVSGHRWFGSPAAVMQGIDQALAAIGACFPRPFTLYSCLADGADRLVARRASLILGSRLVAPLPMPQADYRQDFSPKSQTEFTTLLQQADEVIELPGLTPRSAAIRGCRALHAGAQRCAGGGMGWAARPRPGRHRAVGGGSRGTRPAAGLGAGKNRHFSLKGEPGRLTLEGAGEKLTASRAG